MANPPITIGSFNNVPAPGSPIRSDWPQEISTYVTALGRGSIGTAYGPSADGVHTSAQPVAGMSVTWAGQAGRIYLTLANLGLYTNAAAYVDLTIVDAANASVAAQQVYAPANQPIGLTVVEVLVASVTGPLTRKAAVTATTGTITLLGAFNRRPIITVIDLGGGFPSLTALPADEPDAEAKPAPKKRAR